MSTMLDELARKLKAVAPIHLDNSGANPGDLWLNDYGDGGRYIGNIDDPLYADLIVAAVNALPVLLAVTSAAVEYQQKHDAWMRGEIEGLAPTVLNEAEDRLFAALAELPRGAE